MALDAGAKRTHLGISGEPYLFVKVTRPCSCDVPFLFRRRLGSACLCDVVVFTLSQLSSPCNFFQMSESVKR